MHMVLMKLILFKLLTCMSARTFLGLVSIAITSNQYHSQVTMGIIALGRQVGVNVCVCV